ncbi:hypothetical protein L6452_27453 [Arctium lappa]|uniref:Uncharacterized protein n=1 Tax=Arctium lappa TaxID=4217 RepID=A0ACB8ZWA9_ARCLA|nr:hypothetical protein L6452_27453 [Arctium lappa]
MEEIAELKRLVHTKTIAKIVKKEDKVTEVVKSIKATSEANSTELKKVIDASAMYATKEEFNKLTTVVQGNTEALKCLVEIVSKQRAPAPPASTSPLPKKCPWL